MEPIYGFLIRPKGYRYNNKIDVADKELIVNTEITERDYEFVNREAVVIEVPRGYKGKIKKGDLVLVHHNVFRRWFDVQGNERNSGSFIDEDLYIVNPDQVFAYRSDKWRALEGYEFVYPVPQTDEWDFNPETALVGINLDGDLIGFTPNSEYEFEIEGKKVYRILSHQITWTSKRKEKKSYPQLKKLWDNWTNSSSKTLT